MNIMDIIWSESQRKIIDSDEKRILVSASAGSGKTTVMIARILRLVLQGHRLENMLICTFTRAAAADMRTKLYRELTAYYGSARCTPQERERVRTALKNLSRADISTIDSFCQRIVTKYFYLIGIDPQFEVLGDESVLMKLGAVERAISKSDGEAFEEIRAIFRQKHSDETLKSVIMSVMTYDELNLVPADYDYDEGKVRKSIDEYFAKKKRRIRRAIDSLFSSGSEQKLYGEMLAFLDTGNKELDRCKDAFIKDGVKFLQKKIAQLHEEMGQVNSLVPQSGAEKHLRAIVEAVRRSEKLYAEEKQRRSAVDFADLERYALEILKVGGEEVRNKFRYVFVDEYQDINPLQEELISRVSVDADLFMVGDLKQSIYAFRGCEPRFFKQKYDAFSRKQGGVAFDLNVNYRSGKKIIGFVNSVFSPVMTEEFGSTDYRANRMVASCTSDGEATLHMIVGEPEKVVPVGTYSVKAHSVVKKTKRSAEIQLAASRVVELIEGGATFGDIAVLSRRMKDRELELVELLRKLNIPVSLSEKAYYLERPETGQLIAFLRLIDSRYDEQALMISMLSPLGGFDENELAELKLGYSGTLYEAAMAAKSNEKVRTFFDKLDRYTFLSRMVGADELSDMIVSENGYFNYAYSLGESSAEALDKFLEFLGSVPCKSSLYATLKYIDDQNPYAELSGEENAVKVMTVHRSKGLEFKHVLLIGISSFGDPKNQPPVKVSDGLASEVYFDHKKAMSDKLFLHDVLQNEREMEEELRILYVALTRAKETLDVVITCSEKDDFAECYGRYGADLVDFSTVSDPSKWLVNEFPFARREDINDISVTEADPRPVFFAKADDKLVSELKTYFDFEAPPHIPAKSYVSKLAHKDDEPSVIMFDEPEDTGVDARERGNAYHRALEKLDFAHPDLSVIDEADRKLIDDNKLLAAAENMRRFVGKAYKEKPFMLKMSARELGFVGDGYVLVQGVIDLMISDGENVTIVDYKTGKAHGGFESGYFKQVNLYAEAVQRLLGKNVTSKWLYYIDEQIFVEVK